ncbi:MarR family winged helix-turn-helix transcriptional regulator [Phenylobacterium aquaticum]|uniref:MarR family winged helix-turn-helix transcriptional regulator n=1 Tax=Phenylobacterium aquaticum TaxID=1763816 RepID=UPI001F5CEEAD|nr:MarR family transcriptional regulator [Phenylobacterium aquaticum]MCI3133565.1 MarR family transcriptional regulator [Phenylobacterium aquaticum]
MATDGKMAEAGADPLRLESQLCFALYSASNLMTRVYRPLLQPLGLTYLQYLALLALWEQAPQTFGDLARRLGLDSGTLTPLFKRMEAAGLITRTRDLADERRVTIDLTAKGRELKARAQAVPPAVVSQIPIPLEDLAALKAQVERLVGGLRVAESA